MCVGFVMCFLCMFGFCNVWVCVFVSFVICGSCVCVGFVMCGCVCMCVCVGFLMCGCVCGGFVMYGCVYVRVL